MTGQGLREWFARNRDGLAVGLLGMVSVALGATFLQRPATPVVVQVAEPKPSPSPAPPPPLSVHVTGAVARPGLYQVPAGSRINDAIRAAGGATQEGDPQRLNLAARVADGQQIVVPRKGEARSASASAPPGLARVNINTATVAELDTLPGLGPVMAQRIVAYREQHGPFTRIEQLREAKLVNASTYEKIKDLIDL